MTETVFWVLTALADGRRHGYAILQAATRLSGGAVELRVTTLYATLERLQKQELVAPLEDVIVEGRARRYFELTADGRAALESETARLESRASVARAVLGATGRPSPVVRVGIAG